MIYQSPFVVVLTISFGSLDQSDLWAKKKNRFLLFHFGQIWSEANQIYSIRFQLNGRAVTRTNVSLSFCRLNLFDPQCYLIFLVVDYWKAVLSTSLRVFSLTIPRIHRPGPYTCRGLVYTRNKIGNRAGKTIRLCASGGFFFSFIFPSSFICLDIVVV